MIPAYLYQQIYYGLLLIFILFECFSLYLKPFSLYKSDNRKSIVFMLFFLLAIAIFIGGRPDNQQYFQDSTAYAFFYNRGPVMVDFKKEWLWFAFELFCQRINLDSSAWFTLISIFYFGFAFWGIHRLFPRTEWIALLLLLSNFVFYGGAINGLRNGLAVNIMIVALSYLVDNKKECKYIGLVFTIMAVSVHKSLYLPAVCFLFSYFFKIKINGAIKFYLFSIILSLIAGNYISNIFLGWGFDDRMDIYIGSNSNDIIYKNTFSHSGFRLDFLLYSIVPILLSYYVGVLKKIKNKTYTLLMCTYILANSFWLMVIRSAFSNRFAGLSWFLYAIVIAYPLLNFKLYRNQNVVISFFLLGTIAFSYIMMLK
jgi:hypothetical protein